MNVPPTGPVQPTPPALPARPVQFARPVSDVLDALLSWREPPPPHAPGSHPLWTDPHVSRSMLAAHLDPEDDAASRRPGTIDATVAWLATQLPPGARVLDLGCGPGLYAERLAAAGFEVTGVDFSQNSIAYARSRSGRRGDGLTEGPGSGPEKGDGTAPCEERGRDAGKRVRFLLGDYREIALDETFDAVLLIYLDFGTFSPADARTVLGRVRHWLSPGGVFVFDVPTPAYRKGRDRLRDWSVQPRGFWAAEPHAVLSRTLPYPDGFTYLDEYVVITAGEARVYRVWERCFTEDALRAELAGAELTVRRLHGDLTGAPFVPGSSTVIGAVASVA